MLLAALSHAVKALDEVGIPSIVLKGGALLAAGHVSAARRHLDDIDLWVPPRAAHDAWHAVRAAGFTPLAETPSVTHAGRDSLAAPTHQLPMLRAPFGGLFELHLESHAVGAAGDFDACHAAGVDVVVHGVVVRVPSPLHLLEQLCAHVVVHHFGDLRYWPRHVDDVTALVTTSPSLARLVDRRDEVGLSVRVARGVARGVGAEHALARVFVEPGPVIRAGASAAATAIRAARFARGGPLAVAQAVLPSSSHLRFTGDLTAERTVLQAHARRLARLVRTAWSQASSS